MRSMSAMVESVPFDVKLTVMEPGVGVRETVDGDESPEPEFTTIGAHAAVLRAFSKPMAAAFDSPMQEAETKMLCCCRFSFESVRMLLDYMYYGDINRSVTEEECNWVVMGHLLSLAHLYDVKVGEERLVNEMEGAAAKRLSAESGKAYMEMAETMGLERLEQSAKEYLRKESGFGEFQPTFCV